jgi:hypothetical protein
VKSVTLEDEWKQYLTQTAKVLVAQGEQSLLHYHRLEALLDPCGSPIQFQGANVSLVGMG